MTHLAISINICDARFIIQIYITTVQLQKTPYITNKGRTLHGKLLNIYLLPVITVIKYGRPYMDVPLNVSIKQQNNMPDSYLITRARFSTA